MAEFLRLSAKNAESEHVQSRAHLYVLWPQAASSRSALFPLNDVLTAIAAHARKSSNYITLVQLAMFWRMEMAGAPVRIKHIKVITDMHIWISERTLCLTVDVL